MKNVLIGVSKFESKKGTNCEVAIVKTEFQARAIGNGSFGENVENIFVPDTIKGVLKQDDIGKEIVFDYEVSGGRAYVTGFKVVPLNPVIK